MSDDTDRDSRWGGNDDRRRYNGNGGDRRRYADDRRRGQGDARRRGQGDDRRRYATDGRGQRYVDDGQRQYDDGQYGDGQPYDANGQYDDGQYANGQYDDANGQYADDSQYGDDGQYADDGQYDDGQYGSGQYIDGGQYEQDSQYADDGQPYDVDGQYAGGQYEQDSQYADDGQPYDEAQYADESQYDDGAPQGDADDTARRGDDAADHQDGADSAGRRGGNRYADAGGQGTRGGRNRGATSNGAPRRRSKGGADSANGQDSYGRYPQSANQPDGSQMSGNPFGNNPFNAGGQGDEDEDYWNNGGTPFAAPSRRPRHAHSDSRDDAASGSSRRERRARHAANPAPDDTAPTAPDAAAPADATAPDATQDTAGYADAPAEPVGGEVGYDAAGQNQDEAAYGATGGQAQDADTAGYDAAADQAPDDASPAPSEAKYAAPEEESKPKKGRSRKGKPKHAAATSDALAPTPANGAPMGDEYDDDAYEPQPLSVGGPAAADAADADAPADAAPAASDDSDVAKTQSAQPEDAPAAGSGKAADAAGTDEGASAPAETAADAVPERDSDAAAPAKDTAPTVIESTITPDDIVRYATDFRSERANRVAMHAATASGILPASTSSEGLRALPRDFSVELKQGSITDQRHSGRCWMFASLNVMRYELMHRWNLDDFEFSESYLFFWDKVEKANAYLSNVLSTLDEPTDSRTFQAINEAPVDDGGWWQMFVNLVDKYGLVPASAYPESANSRNSDAFVQYLTTALRGFAADLRARHANGEALDSLCAAADGYMDQVYRMAAIALGEPPVEFTFAVRTKDNADANGDDAQSSDAESTDKPKTGDGTESYDGRDKRKRIVDGPLTPVEFVHKYVPVDPGDYVTLCNAPMDDRPFWQRYQIKWSTNVAGTQPMTFVNVPMDTLKAAAVAQLQAGHPLWFACDCMQYALRDKGVFDQNTVRVDELFGITLPYDKGEAIAYGDAQSNHAMTLTGVNIGADGKPDRWKVENSWGKNSGQDGYYVASDAWFDRYVTELVVHKDFLDKKTRKAAKTEPVLLDPWEPLTTPCE